MTTWFVSKHEATHAWMRHLMASGQVDERVDEAHMVTALDPAWVDAGDVVLGTLPMSLILQVQARGAHFRALVLNDLPRQQSGEERGSVVALLRSLWRSGKASPGSFSAKELIEQGARFVDIAISEGPSQAIPPQPSTPSAAQTDRDARKQVHLAFVSEQLTPIFLAARQFPVGLESVVLLATPRMQRQAVRLQKLLQEPMDGAKPLHVEIRNIGASETYPEQLAAAREAIEAIASAHPGAWVLGNLTGGTKPMALALEAALQEAASAGLRTQTLYTNTDINHYEMLTPAQPTVPMRARLDIGTAFALQGYTVRARQSASPEWQSRARARAELSRHLLRAPEVVFHQLNTLASFARDQYAAERGSRSGVLPSDAPATVAVTNMRGKAEKLRLRERDMALMADAGLLRIDPGHVSVTFSHYDAACYLGGLWLEEWAWNELSGLGLDDLACGVEVREGDSGTPNELDIVAVHNNRMLLIECKTSQQDAKGENKTASTLYKIESISDHLARLHGTKLLLSVRPVSHDALARASAARVALLAPEVRGASAAGARTTYHCLVPGMLREMAGQWARSGVLRSAAEWASPYVQRNGDASSSAVQGAARLPIGSADSKRPPGKPPAGRKVAAKKQTNSVMQDKLRAALENSDKNPPKAD